MKALLAWAVPVSPATVRGVLNSRHAATDSDSDGQRSTAAPPARYSLLPIGHSPSRHRRPLAAGAGAAAGWEACALVGLALLAPNRTRVGLRSKLFTARLMSDSVR